MKREDIKKLFPDATDEQIQQIMDANGADIENAKAKAKAKADADQAEIQRLKDIEAAADELKRQQMTAEQRAEAAEKAATDKMREFTVKSNRVDVEKLFVGAGLKTDDYAPILDGIVGEDLKKSTDIAGSFISILNATKEATEKAVRKEVLGEVTPPAGGGTGKSDAMTKEKFNALSLDDKYAYMEQNPNWKTELK